MKVNIGKAGGKKYFHNLAHEVTTSSSFGFLQPIVCNECAAQDSVKIRIGQSVFLAPMPKPTFGRLNVKTYHSFVPIVDIWHPFEQFLSGQSYHGSQSQYIATLSPQIRIGFYTALLHYMSSFEVYIMNTPHFSSNAVSFASLSPIAEADWHDVEASFYTELSALGGMNFNNILNTSRLNVPGHGLYLRSSAPSEAPESDWVHAWTDSTSNISYIAFGNFTREAQNIRKVLIGCGYQLNDSSDTLTLLPLVAYYKVWFDLFQPARDMTWKETHAFSFMERIEQYNLSDFSAWIADAQAKDRFEDFWVDLAYCYYTQNPDYVSSHIAGASLPIAGTNGTTVLGAQGSGTIAIQQNGSQYQPYIASSSSITQNALDMLKQVYQYVNSKTAIGGRVKEFMRSIYDATSLNDVESNFIGSQSIELQLSPIFSTAGTEDAYLAQVAGRGLGSGAGTEFKYLAKQQGYLISISTIVPLARYAQAIDPNLRHKSKYDYYTQKFDSLTLLPTPKYCIYGNKELYLPASLNPDDYGAGFGNAPSYLEYKTVYNKINGDVSRASTRNAFLPYSLDKLLPFSERGTKSVKNVPGSLLVASSKWRWIGRDEYMGWFNRIFYNSGNSSSQGRFGEGLPDVDDNFIIYNYVDLTKNSFALPTADSWQTDGFGEHISIEKA